MSLLFETGVIDVEGELSSVHHEYDQIQIESGTCLNSITI